MDLLEEDLEKEFENKFLLFLVKRCLEICRLGWFELVRKFLIGICSLDLLKDEVKDSFERDERRFEILRVRFERVGDIRAAGRLFLISPF